MRDVAGAAPRGSSRFDSKSISGGVSLDVTSSIDEWKYGRWYAARAAATAIALEASRLKNQTPGSRPPRWTYVRTLISWKLEIHGSGGVSTGRTPLSVNGTRPTQALAAN